MKPIRLLPIVTLTGIFAANLGPAQTRSGWQGYRAPVQECQVNFADGAGTLRFVDSYIEATVAGNHRTVRYTMTLAGAYDRNNPSLYTIEAKDGGMWKEMLSTVRFLKIQIDLKTKTGTLAIEKVSDGMVRPTSPIALKCR